MCFFTISDLESGFTSVVVGGYGWGNLLFTISFCMYSSGEMWVWLRVTVIHDMRSSNKICIYFSGIEVSISQDLQSVICNYFSGGKRYRYCRGRCIYYS